MVKEEIRVEIDPKKKKFLVEVPYKKEIITFMKFERGFVFEPETKRRLVSMDKIGIKKLVKLFNFLKGQKNPYSIILDNPTKEIFEKLGIANQEKRELDEKELNSRMKSFELKLNTQKILNLELFNYQKEGILFMERNEGACILGDEMGLGKTIQTLAWCSLKEVRTLIVCPKSLIYNWASEIDKWIKGGSYKILQGKEVETFFDKKKKKKSATSETDAHFFIINYDIIHKLKGDLNFDAIIFDEAHYVKNSKAIRTKSSLKIAKKIKHKLLLSGTSIKNRPIEFWTQLNLIRPDIFDNWFFYAKRYCGAYRGRFGWEVGRATNQLELNEKIKDFYLRREKILVAKDLPEKLISEISTDISVPWIKKNSSLEMITDAKIRAAEAKINSSIGLIETILEMDEKVIFFSDYVKPCETVYEHFSKIGVWLKSEDSAEIRNEKIKEFQKSDDKKIFMATIKLAGVGLNLTNASKMVFNDLPWSPADLAQAEDRIYRIGQKKVSNIYRMVSKCEIDEVILKQLKYKKKNVDLVLKGEFIKENFDMTPIEALQSRLTKEFGL